MAGQALNKNWVDLNKSKAGQTKNRYIEFFGKQIKKPTELFSLRK
jgi:hypothetical protein